MFLYSLHCRDCISLPLQPAQTRLSLTALLGMMEDAYIRSPQEVLRYFAASEQQGLSEAQVQIAKAKYGRNGTTSLNHRLDQEVEANS